jgi:hypothetical protein
MNGESVKGRHAWDGPAGWPHEKDYNARNKDVWLPKPLRGRFMPRKKDEPGSGVRSDARSVRQPPADATARHLMIVPGPEGLYQIIKVDLRRPVARGFRTPEQARGWIGRAVRAGILPEGVVEVEPPEQNVSEP